METRFIFVITNCNGEFIKACETRETAKNEMEAWRQNFINGGLVKEVSKLDAVYHGKISFKVTDRDGSIKEFEAREVILH